MLNLIVAYLILSLEIYLCLYFVLLSFYCISILDLFMSEINMNLMNYNPKFFLNTIKKLGKRKSVEISHPPTHFKSNYAQKHASLIGFSLIFCLSWWKDTVRNKTMDIIMTNAHFYKRGFQLKVRWISKAVHSKVKKLGTHLHRHEEFLFTTKWEHADNWLTIASYLFFSIVFSLLCKVSSVLAIAQCFGQIPTLTHFKTLQSDIDKWWGDGMVCISVTFIRRHSFRYILGVGLQKHHVLFNLWFWNKSRCSIWIYILFFLICIFCPKRSRHRRYDYSAATVIY